MTNYQEKNPKSLSKKNRVTPGFNPGQRDLAPGSELFACVARTIPPKEARQRAGCEEKVMEEYNKLKGKVWKDEHVRSWKEVKEEARIQGREVHVGSLHELVVEKGSELEVGNPNRKLKGRVVFLGDRVTDADGRHAVFEELSSSPAAMPAGKFADAYGCPPQEM